MHRSLRPRANLILITVSAVVVAAGLLFPTEPSRLLVTGVGACLGAVAGALQLRAISEQKDRFLDAASAIEVRQALTASMYGRLSIYTLWFSGLILLVVAFVQKEGLLVRWIVGYAAFALVRESIALKGCFMLLQAEEKKKAG